MVAIVVRVGTPGAAAFQLRKGEEGLSVFDPNSVDPPLSESKLLEPFRDGSYLIVRSIAAIEELGMRVEWIEGDGVLPERLRRSHREIRPGAQMTRTQFKSALKELE
jgi:hypothetical protein